MCEYLTVEVRRGLEGTNMPIHAAAVHQLMRAIQRSKEEARRHRAGGAPLYNAMSCVFSLCHCVVHSP